MHTHQEHVERGAQMPLGLSLHLLPLLRHARNIGETQAKSTNGDPCTPCLRTGEL